MPPTQLIPGSQKLTRCSNHCTDEEAKSLRDLIPEYLRHGKTMEILSDVIDRVERLYQKEVETAKKYDRDPRSPGLVAEALGEYLDGDAVMAVLSRGEDVMVVQRRVDWAKWVASAAKIKLFHEPNEVCGSMGHQVRAAMERIDGRS
ncbi:uncharacterized protein BDZ99DRAFT_527336 [Mytilinidion resinicola]|uniref:Uncharacterized protein n=1 Tax=Mytilinidion resinicola TaxID=574789 RepID=A0A6A6Y225_9PEZI|nr:uncharacterized protein BDZ99DRAFT_527336 [Mytilinidion resinicola]KAF2802608.1 hypothetical protein BDZ99DRAFT_527336 [Mytilinidion resinicola]